MAARGDFDLAQDLEKVLDSLSCGLMARDADGRLIYANQRLLEWLGYTLAEVQGRPFQTLVPEDVADLVTEEMRAVEEGDLRARLTVLKRKDGTSFPVLILPNRRFGDDGRPDGGIGVIVELASVQTAKSAGYREDEGEVCGRLQRIALELQSLCVTLDVPAAGAVRLDHPSLDELTAREREVLAHLVAGERVPAIAQQLFISQHTVRGHLKAIFRKVSVENQSELIQYVRSLG